MDTAKRLVGPLAPGTVAATVYTVPAATTTIVRSLHVANTTASPATITVSIGVDAAGTEVVSQLSVPAHGTYDWSTFLVLATSEVIQALQATANALTLTISGVEVT